MISTQNGLIRPHSSKLAAIVRLLDAVAIIGTLWLSGQFFGVQFYPNQTILSLIALSIFWFVAGFRLVYASWRTEGLVREISQIWASWSIAFVSLIVVWFLLHKIVPIQHHKSIFSWYFLAGTALTTIRLGVRLFLRVLRRNGKNTRTAAIIGMSKMALKLRSTIEQSPEMGLRFAGYYSADPAELTPEHQGSLMQLIADARAGKTDYVYITLPLSEEEKISDILAALSDTTASVYIVPNLLTFELLHARWQYLNSIPVVSIHESPHRGVDGWLKRVEDVVLSLFFLTLLAIPMILIALAIKFTSPGPILFKQRRYGLNGKEVRIYKFRSMTCCEDGGTIRQAQKGDARVTPLGAFLRRSSLDELPQFWNVLQGRMSIVGPRPHAIAHNEEYRKLIKGYMLRHKVKPGITGWAQINGWRGETDTLEKMQKRVEHDLYYITHWSLWLDLKIIVLTVLRAFRDPQAY